MSSTSRNPLVRAVRGVGHAFKAFFSHDLALKRADGGAVHVVLKERPAAPVPRRKGPPSREELSRQREQQELTLMRTQLAELLAELPETRETMRHLVFVEQALEKKGLKALQKLPLDVLQRALVQLEGLVTNWSPLGLAALRSRMAVAIIDREHQDPNAEADAYRTAAVLDHEAVGGPPSAPGAPPPMEVHESTDEEALAAAYALLGNLARSGETEAVPSTFELQGELASPASRAVEREAQRPAARALAEPDAITLRVLHD